MIQTNLTLNRRIVLFLVFKTADGVIPYIMALPKALLLYHFCCIAKSHEQSLSIFTVVIIEISFSSLCCWAQGDVRK